MTRGVPSAPALAAARTRPRGRREDPGRTYPYQITCTACDARLVAVHHEWVVLVGPRPIEIVAGPEGEAHLACHQCGNMVIVDRDLLLLL